MRAKTWPLKARILLSLASLLVGLLLAEVVLRAVGYDPVLSHEWYLGCRVRTPNKDVVMINPKFLDDKFYEAGEGHTKVLAMGDSFTEGFPVAAQYKYTRVLQEALEEQGWNAWVLNMGLGNSGPDQHLRLLKEYVLPRVKPDIVVWQFCANDLGDNSRQAVYDVQDDALVPLDVSTHWLCVRQRIFDYFPLPARVKRNCVLFRAAMRAVEAAGRQPLTDASIAWGEKKVRLSLQELDRLSSLHGFEVYCTLVVPQALYLAKAEPEKWARRRRSRRSGPRNAAATTTAGCTPSWRAGPTSSRRASKTRRGSSRRATARQTPWAAGISTKSAIAC